MISSLTQLIQDVGVKPYYQDDGRAIYYADCRDVLPLFPRLCVNLVLTDIPYGEVNRVSNGLRNLDKGVADVWDWDYVPLIQALCSLLSGSVYVFCGTEQVSGLRAALVAEKLSTRVVVWEKTNPSPMNGQHIWLSGVELAVFGKKRKATFNGHCRNTVLRFPNGRSKSHPTEKPLALFKELVDVSSSPGDIVLDPFLGSGTTAIAAGELGRYCIGVERDEECCEIAANRCAADVVDRIRRGEY